jgi:tRNA nucleotidyltransferase/poly(A) polymerase
MVSRGALADDPLRTLRAVRLALDLELTIEPDTAAADRTRGAGLERVAAERIFGEFKQLIRSPAVRTGLQLMDAHGITAQVLPELLTLRGVEQNVFHHLDVHDHTLEVLDQVAAIERDPLGAGSASTRRRSPSCCASRSPTSSRAATRCGLRPCCTTPPSRGRASSGQAAGFGFPGHDREGARVARTVLRRLRASGALADHVVALCLHHLRLGFLVHERPLDRRSLWRYLRATEPHAADVTIFTVADRLATRGKNAEPAIQAHVALAREVLRPALARRGQGAGEPLLRGDELARELGLRPGRELGELLDQLEEDRFAGEIRTPADALRRARELRAG